MRPKRFGLIIIGDEILDGKRQDSHFAKVRQLMTERALMIAWVKYIGDDPPTIVETLRQSRQNKDIVLCTGGIGATPDDHTRLCAALAFERPLCLHPEAKKLIEGRIISAKLGDLNSPVNLNRLKMGEFPKGSEIIANPYNQIPGFFIEEHYFVPGFPEMAWPMIAWVLDRYQSMQPPSTYSDMSVILQGVMESELTPLLAHLETQFDRIKVYSLPSLQHPQWGKCLEIGIKGHPTQAELAYQVMLDEIERLDAHVCSKMQHR